MAFNGQLLDGMVIFTELVRTGSFTNTAISSGHSTSYISKEINKLEERLGVRLLHRTTRSLNLTPEGELYLEQCKLIIHEAENAENTLSGHQLEPSGTLRVSCPTSFDISRMRTMFARFIECYPQVHLELDFSNRKVDVVAEGFDVAIRVAEQLSDSSLISQHVLRSHVLTLVAPSYLKKYGVPKSPADLPNHQVINYSGLKQPNLWPFKDGNNKETIVQVNSHALTNSSQMQLALCLSGQGIVRLPLILLSDELKRGKLVRLFDDYQPHITNVNLLYPSRKHLSSKVRAFNDFIITELENG